MSVDAKVTKDLMQTLADGRDGFEHAAERLKDDRPDLGAKMREFSEQRASFHGELESMAARYGDDIDEEGSTAAAAHRGWMSLKDAITGSDAEGVLDAAEQGEDHAVAEYEKALEQDDLSSELRTVVERQSTAVRETHDTVRALRDAN